MVNILRVQQGDVVPVRFQFREVRTDALNGQRIQPSGAVVTVYYPDGTVQLANGSLVFEQAGVFILYWNTSGLAYGDYKAQLRFGASFSSTQGGATNIGSNDAVLRLVKAL